MSAARNWSLPIDMSAPISSPQGNSSSPDENQAQSPLSHASSPNSNNSPLQLSPFQNAIHTLPDWTMQQRQHHMAAVAAAAQQQENPLSPLAISQFMDQPLMNFNPLAATNFATNPLDYLPPTTQAALHNGLLDTTFTTMASIEPTTQAMHWNNPGMENWQDFQNTLSLDGLQRLGSVGSNSPTGTYLEVLSLPSSAGEGWAMVDWSRPDQFTNNQNTAIFNPSQTLHLRTNSDSSEGANSLDFGNFEEIPPFPYSPFSPDSDGHGDVTTSHRNSFAGDGLAHAHETLTNAAAAGTVAIKTEAAASIKMEFPNAPTIKSEFPPRHSPGSGSGAGSSSSSPSSAASSRRNSGPRKSPIAKAPKTIAPKAVARRTSNSKKDGTGEKKVGRRKGPLLPEQRKQASEIRKLRACLRCKFLKKTCDKGEPCAGCQPSHARLWQVPCTRIDIKDIGYFLKDWRADQDRHIGPGVPSYTITGFSQKETLMWVTHGYGFALPVMVREVFVADEDAFVAEWAESGIDGRTVIPYAVKADRLDVGSEGVRLEALAEYLDSHIDGPFEDFIDDHFEGTPFITEILKTAHRYYVKEKMPIIRKALKLVLAYNLTMQITMVENSGSENHMHGRVDQETSRQYGKTVAPVMVNYQIKCALAEMWRELQKDILEELSALYSGVYSGEKMKNWPTIFMLASILLAVWEEMQFDCHYRVPDPAAVSKFCTDMETTPVGVIVGLFHAISQKLPAFADWDTAQHGHILHNNVAVCEAMTEVRQHVEKHDAYLRTRKETQFDASDFDSLSNKFLSKLIIKAN